MAPVGIALGTATQVKTIHANMSASFKTRSCIGISSASQRYLVQVQCSVNMAILLLVQESTCSELAQTTPHSSVLCQEFCHLIRHTEEKRHDSFILFKSRLNKALLVHFLYFSKLVFYFPLY